MPDRPLIVLSLDGLATSALGCYGSSWNSTPAIDTIASSGMVWDRLVAQQEDSERALGELFAANPPWIDGWRKRGTTELITDIAEVGDSATCFDRVTKLNQVLDEHNDSAVEIEDTSLASLIASAVDRDLQGETWSLMWLHSGFLTRCWDAPRRLFPIDSSEWDQRDSDQARDVQEYEPPAIFESNEVPCFEIDQQSHPDLLTSWMRTYGCQVRLVDWMIEVLLQSLSTEDPRVAILGTSGFCLGQNGWVGYRQGCLRSPEIRLPLIVSDFGPVRMPHLTPFSRLRDVLDELGKASFSFASAEAWMETTDCQVKTESERVDRAVTTLQWYFARDLDSSEHLFLKPDDVEDFNDVARVRPDVVDDLGEDKK